MFRNLDIFVGSFQHLAKVYLKSTGAQVFTFYKTGKLRWKIEKIENRYIGCLKTYVTNVSWVFPNPT